MIEVFIAWIPLVISHIIVRSHENNRMKDDRKNDVDGEG